MRERNFVVNHDAVVLNRANSVDRFFVAFKFCGDKFHVVRLPGQRWQAHIHGRYRNAVDAAALVVLAFQSERIQDLALVLVQQIHPAVASTLTA